MMTNEDTQFEGVEGRALEILEREAWGDVEHYIRNVEVAIALLCEATSPWLPDWDDKVSPAFDEERGIEVDEFELTREQVRGLSDSWRLAYVAKLVPTLCLQYGLSSTIGARGPERHPFDQPAPPGDWSTDERTNGIARLLRALSSLLGEKVVHDVV